jgi:ribA/ribD-fused uncharacterized protein
MTWNCSFRGELHFLSNFYPSPFIIDGVHYPTVEHFIQATKTNDLNEREKIANASTPSKAKMLGRKCKLRPEWEYIKVEMMFKGVFAKFSQNKELGEKLINTPDHLLVEKNDWGDKFWGVDIHTGYGLNKLGEILKSVKYMLIDRNVEKSLRPFKKEHINSFEQPEKYEEKEPPKMLFKQEDILETKLVKMYKLKDGSVYFMDVYV